MGAAMTIHRHYEKLEIEDEKGRSSAELAASLWYLMMTKPRAVKGAGPGHL